MPDLTLQNIEEISLFVKRQEIIVSHLADNLTDHICCDVESEMERGLTFVEAYEKVKNIMGPRRLKQIQEETLYAIDSKYRKMKKTMKISGIAGTIIFGIAVLFRIQHWPFAGYMLVLGAFILGFIFMPSALGVLWKETHSSRRLMLFISGFITGMLFISGTLFKIQHWPAAGTLLGLSVLLAVFFFIPSLLLNRLSDPANKAKKPVYLLGTAGMILYIAGMLFKIQHWPLSALLMIIALILLFIVVLPWYTWLTWKTDTHISSAFIFIITGSMLIIVPGALVNLNLRNMYNDGYYRHLEQEQDLSRVMLEINSSLLRQYHDSSCYRKMESLHDRTSRAFNYLGNIQEQMVRASEEKHGNPLVNTALAEPADKEPEIRFTRLTRPFYTLPAKDFLIAGCSARQNLDKVLADYMNYVSSLKAEPDPERFKGLLDPAIYLPDDNPAQAEMTLLSALHSLEILKNNLLAVESHTLISVVNQK